jgi:hypothetical protein
VLTLSSCPHGTANHTDEVGTPQAPNRRNTRGTRDCCVINGKLSPPPRSNAIRFIFERDTCIGQFAT